MCEPASMSYAGSCLPPGSDLLRAVSDLFAAGTETTATTLQWLLVYMINFPHLQKKCREEILKVRNTELPGGLFLINRLNRNFYRDNHVRYDCESARWDIM